jgi:hypothetical protein
MSKKEKIIMIDTIMIVGIIILVLQSISRINKKDTKGYCSLCREQENIIYMHHTPYGMHCEKCQHRLKLGNKNENN